MCILQLWSFEKLDFKVQTSFSFLTFSKFCYPLPDPLPPFIFSIFKLLSMISYGGKLFLNSSSPWSGASNHFSSFSIPLSLIFKKQKTAMMKKIQGLQVLYETTLEFRYIQQLHEASLNVSVFWNLLSIRCF